MQSRIDQMLSAWNQLDLLKSVRAQTPQQITSKQTVPLPMPDFGKMPTMPLIGVVKSKMEDQNSTVSSSETATNAGVSSTPPRLTSNRLSKIFSSPLELPELPKHLVEDDFSGSRTLSPPASPRAASSPRGSHIGKLRKKARKKFNQFKIDVFDLAQKMAPPTSKPTSAKSSPERKPSSRKLNEALSSIPPENWRQLITTMGDYAMTDAYQEATGAKQTILFNAKLISELPADSPLRTPQLFETLKNEVCFRMQNHIVDTVVDLQDPRFNAHYVAAENACFEIALNEKSVEAKTSGDGISSEWLALIHKNFLRDFSSKSRYSFKNSEGAIVPITSPEHLIELIGEGDTPRFLKVVTNFASQSFGIFLRNILFQRIDTKGARDSLLKIYDGTPISPASPWRQEYVLRKGADGITIVELKATCNHDIRNLQRSMGVQDLDLTANSIDGGKSYSISDEAFLMINASVAVDSTGNWKLSNPHIRAEGWNLPKE